MREVLVIQTATPIGKGFKDIPLVAGDEVVVHPSSPFPELAGHMFTVLSRLDDKLDILGLGPIVRLDNNATIPAQFLVKIDKSTVPHH